MSERCNYELYDSRRQSNYCHLPKGHHGEHEWYYVEADVQAAFERGRQAAQLTEEQVREAFRVIWTIGGAGVNYSDITRRLNRSLAQPAASGPSEDEWITQKAKEEDGAMVSAGSPSAGSREGQPLRRWSNIGPDGEMQEHPLGEFVLLKDLGPTESPLAGLVAKLEEAIWFHDLWEKYGEGHTHKAETMPLSTSGEQMCMMCLRIAEHRAALAAAGGTHDKP